MSSIEDLIGHHCPHGVPYVPLSKVAELRRGTTLTKKTATPGDVPVVAGGRTAAYYHSESNRDGETIVIAGSGAYAGFVSWWNQPIWVSDAFSVKPDRTALLPRYVFFWLQSKQDLLHSMKSGGGVPHVYAKDAAPMRIPVPPLEVQREIVRVLDQFTQLEAELEARKQQYEHYRADLLTNAAQLGQSVELGELGRIVTGRTPKSSDSSAWGDHIDFITPSDIKNGMKWVRTPSRRLSVSGAESLSKAIVRQGSLLVTCIGADMGKTVLNENACATNQQINSLTLDPGVDSNFVFHVLTSMRDKIRAQGERAGGTMPIINKSDFSKIRIALPSLEEQQRIASTLDEFDALVNDLSVGLPAELAARRQQYEYYRDKLLTFKEAAA